MPSDAKKRAQQKKKEQASNRNKKPVARVTNEETNGSINGTTKEDRELTAEGTFDAYNFCYLINRMTSAINLTCQY